MRYLKYFIFKIQTFFYDGQDIKNDKTWYHEWITTRDFYFLRNMKKIKNIKF